MTITYNPVVTYVNGGTNIDQFGIRTGAVVASINQSTGGTIPDSSPGKGLLLSPYAKWKFQPLASSGTSVANGATLTAAGALQLVADNVLTVPYNINGQLIPTYFIDPVNQLFPYGRVPTVTRVTGSSAPAANVTINGYDYRWQPMEEISSFEALAADCNPFKKAFAAILAVYIDQPGTYYVGCNNIFGLPYYCNDFSDIRLCWNQTVMTTPGTSPDFAFIAGDTTTPSATTGDVRGTINTDNIGTTVDPNGSIWLSVDMFLYGAQGTAQSIESRYGLTQYSGS